MKRENKFAAVEVKILGKAQFSICQHKIVLLGLEVFRHYASDSSACICINLLLEEMLFVVHHFTYCEELNAKKKKFTVLRAVAT